MQSNYHNLPLINGVAQQFGTEYKASDCVFNEKKKSFTLNIAGAYAADAQVDSYIRSYQLRKNGLTITDQFQLKQTIAPNQVNFLVWDEPDLAKEGVIGIHSQEQKLTLKYDAKQFEAKSEKIQQTDPRLSKVWGKNIYRIVLTAKQQTIKGTYRFEINE
jgi:hypothetical protein